MTGAVICWTLVNESIPDTNCVPPAQYDVCSVQLPIVSLGDMTDGSGKVCRNPTPYTLNPKSLKPKEGVQGTFWADDFFLRFTSKIWDLSPNLGLKTHSSSRGRPGTAPLRHSDVASLKLDVSLQVCKATGGSAGVSPAASLAPASSATG